MTFTVPEDGVSRSEIGEWSVQARLSHLEKMEDKIKDLEKKMLELYRTVHNSKEFNNNFLAIEPFSDAKEMKVWRG